MNAEVSMLLAMRTGDEAAARSLWQRHFARLRAYVYAMCSSEEIAQDVAQMVFLKVLELPASQVHAVKDAPAWLTRMARNLMLNTLRGERRLRARDARTRRGDASGTDSGIAVPPMALGELMEAVTRLGEQHREVIVLKHVAGLSFDQIADALDEPRTTIASRHAAALAALRRLLHPPDSRPREESCEPRTPPAGLSVYRGRAEP